MQYEFNYRIAAQRAILRAVSRKTWGAEQLLGLSRKAIDRWAAVNRLQPRSQIVELLIGVSSNLFFLANKSQEHITDEYRAIRSEMAAACIEIGEEVNRMTL